MSATTFEETTIQGAPRRLVEDAWASLNRVYGIGTAALLAVLLLLWVVGGGPGSGRSAGPDPTPAGAAAGAPLPRVADAPLTPLTPLAPAPSNGAAPLAGAPVPNGSAANGRPAPELTGSTGSTGSAAATTAVAAVAINGSAGTPADTTGPADPRSIPSADETTNALPRAVAGAPVARLYFGSDQAWPSGQVGPSLAPVLARLRAEPDSQLLVSGFHDSRGSAERNAALAQRRAQSVRSVLIREGVAADRIVLARPQQSQGSGPDREARRVEVTIAR